LLPLFLLLLSSPDAVYLEHSVILDCTTPDSGYIETTIESVVPLTASGVQRYSEVSASYRNTWESLDVSASISHWRPGRGSDTALIHEFPHSSLLPDGRLESSLREVIIEFPGIEIGDTLNIEIRRNIQHLPMDDFYSYTFYSASIDSIRHSVFRVLWASSMEMHSEMKGYFETLSYDIDSSVNCSIWESGPQDPLPHLSFSPDPESASPSVTVSSSTPEEVSRGLYRVLDLDCCRGEPSLADSIIFQAGREPWSLSGWVSREIEYLSGDWGEDPGYSPRNPPQTLENRSGVCRDKAVLLLWLLRHAGYSPIALLTSVSGSLESYPGSRSFDHMLVALDDTEGRRIFLDPSGTLSPQGFTYSLRGCGYLPLTSSGSPVEYFPDDFTGDSISIHIDGSFIENSSTVSGDFDIRFSGSAEELFRSMLSSVEHSRRNLLVERLFGMLPGSSINYEGDPSDSYSPFRVFGSGSWSCGTVRGENFISIILPGLETIDLVSFRAAALILPGFRDEIHIGTPYTAHLHMHLTDLPDGAVELPPPYESQKYTIETAYSGGTVTVDERISVQPAYPDSLQLSEIRNGFLGALSTVFRTVIIR
jgi:hypothetical protein